MLTNPNICEVGNPAISDGGNVTKRNIVDVGKCWVFDYGNLSKPGFDAKIGSILRLLETPGETVQVHFMCGKVTHPKVSGTKGGMKR